MAERIVSPAVFTNEIDSTYLVEGIGQIGGAVVGPFTKGPAFSPTVVRSVNQLEALFGTPQGLYYQPFTAREYLLNQGVVTIVRTGALEGHKVSDALILTASYESGSLDEDNELGVTEGDIQTQPYILGVLANTLTEVDPATQQLIAKKDLASPNQTSIGFRGTRLLDMENQEVDTSGDGDFDIEITEDGIQLDMDKGLPLFKELVQENDIEGNPKFDDEGNPVMISVRHYEGQLELNQVYQGTQSHLDTFSFSINPSDSSTLINVFGKSPQKNKKPGYWASYFESTQQFIFDLIEFAGAKFKLHIAVSDDFLNFSDLDGDADNDGTPNASDPDYQYKPYDGAGQGEHACRPAHTPSIMSQIVSGTRYELFKIATRSFGRSANSEIKVGIYNVKTAGTLDGTEYGSFSLVVRGINDNDKTQDVLEDYRELTLDPASPRYIARVIGDRYTYINEMGKVIERGDYANRSNWIRIEMPVEASAPTQCIPYGHAAYKTPFGSPVNSNGIPFYDLPEPKYSRASQYSRVPGRYFSGAVFNQDSPDGVLVMPNASKDTNELFKPIPENAQHAGTGFYLDTPGEVYMDIDGVLQTEVVEPIPAKPASATDEYDARKQRRFLVGFQGGDDGHSPVLPIMLGADISPNNVQGMDCSKRFSPGSQAYERAFKALSNQDEFDINLLTTPGLSMELHRSIVNMGVDLCETREDCFYILDCVSATGQPGKVTEAVAQASTLDSNYAATYYPWVKILDPATNALQVYPPSAVMPAVYAANDKSAAEWFAPAGLNRGGLEQAVSVMDRLTFAERDELYEGKVNPIAAFPGQGIVAFGQKTLQRRASALDRINVRRLLINLKKFVASTSRYLLFEQNTAATRNKFLAIVNPYLEAVQQRQGLYAFNVIMDESNNTPDLIDRNILYGQIFLQPARAVEFIIVDFNLQATGASFG